MTLVATARRQPDKPLTAWPQKCRRKFVGRKFVPKCERFSRMRAPKRPARTDRSRPGHSPLSGCTFASTGCARTAGGCATHGQVCSRAPCLPQRWLVATICGPSWRLFSTKARACRSRLTPPRYFVSQRLRIRGVSHLEKRARANVCQLRQAGVSLVYCNYADNMSTWIVRIVEHRLRVPSGPCRGCGRAVGVAGNQRDAAAPKVPKISKSHRAAV